MRRLGRRHRFGSHRRHSGFRFRRRIAFFWRRRPRGSATGAGQSDLEAPNAIVDEAERDCLTEMQPPLPEPRDIQFDLLPVDMDTVL